MLFLFPHSSSQSSPKVDCYWFLPVPVHELLSWLGSYYLQHGLFNALTSLPLGLTPPTHSRLVTGRIFLKPISDHVSPLLKAFQWQFLKINTQILIIDHFIIWPQFTSSILSSAVFFLVYTWSSWIELFIITWINHTISSFLPLFGLHINPPLPPYLENTPAYPETYFLAKLNDYLLCEAEHSWNISSPSSCFNRKNYSLFYIFIAQTSIIVTMSLHFFYLCVSLYPFIRL